MIYLFDRAKKLQKIIPRKHIINANPTVVRNGIYQLAVEVPLFYEDKKGTQYNYQKSVGKATFAGHYDVNGRFQLYKIYSRNITANEQGEFLLFDGVHIFFDEAKAMGNIHDRRFRDSEAKAPADAAFNSIGWTIIDYDVTDRHDINFYRASVTDAWNELISTYGVEFDYELQFDGRKIISKNIIMKKQIGRWTGQRFAYGTNVMTLTQEQDESEVYTAAVGRGRGEESGDGFGPRLEFGDIAWSKDGITKPVGQNYIELPSATAEYGFIENGVVKPRIAPEIVFENIEDKKKLADSTYYWLLENCVPKATWKTEVARIGNLELGDTVGVLYKAAGIIKRARVEKIEYNLLDPELSKLTLGDFHHFENRQMKRINAQIKRLGRDSNDRITRIKNEWNAWIDNQFTAAMNQFEQNLIDQQAQIEADRENMTNLINTKTEEFDASLAAGMADAERKRQENYTALSSYVDTTVDTARTDLESDIASSIAEAERIAKLEYEEIRGTITSTINTTRTAIEKKITDSIAESERKAQAEHDAIEGRIRDEVVTTKEDLESSIETSIRTAKQYAEQQAQAKAEAVRTDLETVTSGHRSMIDSLQDNVMNIDDFLGDKSVGLDELLYNERVLFEEKLNNVDTWHYNMLRGSRFDEGYWTPFFGEIRTDEEVPYYYFDPSTTTSNLPYVQSTQEIVFEQGETYRLSFDWQTYAVRAVDYVFIIASPDDGGSNINIGVSTSTDRISGTNLFTSFGSEYGRYYIEFSPFRTIRGFIRIGANLNNNENGRRHFKIRLPYLTTTDNTRWLYHQLDSTQNIEEITRRVMQLEDGTEEFITKNQFDFETKEINGTIKSVLETVDESSLIIQNHEDWILTNGASIERTVDGFESKAWLTDMHNPNIIPHSAVQNADSRVQWDRSLTNVTGSSYTDWMAVRHTAIPRSYIGVRSPVFEVTAGKNYVLTFESWENGNDSANTSGLMDYIFLSSSDAPNQTLWSFNNRKAIGTINGATIYRNEIKFTANNSTKSARILIGTKAKVQGLDTIFRFRQPKLEMGTQATPYHNAFSNLSQRADEISLAVQGIDTSGFLSQSDIQIVPDYVQIGSQRLDGSNIGSLLRVSPTGIDIVAEAMRLSGDLYVDGDITALAVNAARGDIAYLKANILTADSINATHIQSEVIGAEQIKADSVLINKLFANDFAANHISSVSLKAVEGEFAKLFAAQVKANTIDVDYISGRTAWFERMYLLNANIERLTAQFVFTDAINAKVGNFIDLNVGTIRSSILTANTIETSMLKASVVTSAKIKVDDVLVNRIIAQSVYANDVTSKIGNFIDLNAGEIVTAGLSANVISSDHIQVGTALIDKMFATSARIDQLITKTHFVNEMHALTLNVVDLNASQIRTKLLSANTIEADWIKGGTALLDKIFATTGMFERMMAKSGFVTTLSAITLDLHELTIWRPDGVAFVRNGMERFGHPVMLTIDIGDDVTYNNKYFETNARGAQQVAVATGDHAGRYYNLVVGVGMRNDAQHASTRMAVIIRPQNVPSGASGWVNYVEEFTVFRDNAMQYHTLNYPMGRPTYGAMSFTIEFWRIGDSELRNPVQLRTRRSWVSA